MKIHKFWLVLCLALAAPATVAQVAISALPAAGPLTGTEVAPVVQGGTTKKATLVNIAGLATKSTVGLSNVDNTSDASKPVSTAQQTALDLKANIASPTFTGTVSGITKAMVGLGNADNTSDANKPVSTATQTALDLKAPLASPTFTGTVAGITAAMVGAPSGSGTSSGTNTGDQDLSALAPKASPTFTGTVSGITASMVGLGNVTNNAQTQAAIVPNTAPAAGRILVGNAGGTAYAPVAMSGDGLLASTGALTLGTVNGNVGSFTNASITVNAKGLVTAASSGSAAGDVVGPGSATDNAVARFDTTTGKLIQDSVLTVSDTGSFSTAGTANRINTPTTNNALVDTLFSASATTQAAFGVQTKASNTYDVVRFTYSDGTCYFCIQRDGNAVLNQKFGNVSSYPLDVQYQGTSQFKVGFGGTVEARVGFNGGSGFFTTDASGNVVALGKITGNHFLSNGTTPTVGGSCGTSPTIAGKDSGFKITVGTGSPTSCTATVTSWGANAPACTANASVTTTPLNVTTTATSVVVSSTALTAAEVLHVVCIGF